MSEKKVSEKYCLDCTKVISKVSIRCCSCSNKNRKGTYSLSKDVWNKGLTKYTDNRVKEVGMKIKLNAKDNPNFGNKNRLKDDVGYSALHIWIKRHKQTNNNICEICSKYSERIELANISGEYKRDVNDFEWLCPKCHRYKDETFATNENMIRDYNGKFFKRVC